MAAAVAVAAAGPSAAAALAAATVEVAQTAGVVDELAAPRLGVEVATVVAVAAEEIDGEELLMTINKTPEREISAGKAARQRAKAPRPP